MPTAPEIYACVYVALSKLNHLSYAFIILLCSSFMVDLYACLIFLMEALHSSIRATTAGTKTSRFNTSRIRAAKGSVCSGSP